MQENRATKIDIRINDNLLQQYTKNHVNAIMDYLSKYFITVDNNRKEDINICILQVDGAEGTGKTTILKSIDYAFNEFFESTDDNLIVHNAKFVEEEVKNLKRNGVIFKPAIRFRKALRDKLNETTYQQSIEKYLSHIAENLFNETNSGTLVLLRDALLTGFLTYLSIPEQVLTGQQYETVIDNLKTFQQNIHSLVKQELEFLNTSVQSIITNKKLKNLILAYDRFLLSNIVYSIITEFIINCRDCSDFKVQIGIGKNSFYEYVSSDIELQAQILDTLLASPHTDNIYKTVLNDRIKQLEKIGLFVMSQNNVRYKMLLYQIDNDIYGFDKETRFDVYRQLLFIRYVRQIASQEIESIDSLHQILNAIKISDTVIDFINAFAWYNVQIMDTLFDNVKKVLYIQMPDHVSMHFDII